ncbi:Transcriptional corepressor SEUSS [Porphyridium purpureum]|uniref:Transcriptional corepressor SEUSS n=1 Tax=Porphyridium purpureum TaxID=35688 RepID=A0A5J4YWU4_PORPP|nr:Transcriptional corepressor SEUSS [Porphyridium purpureum]|eukprot:POR4985..scf209_3
MSLPLSVSGGGNHANSQRVSSQGKCAEDTEEMPPFVAPCADAGAALDTFETFLSRGPILSMNGVGQYVRLLMNFNEEQRKCASAGNSLQSWKELIAKYFSPEAFVFLDLYDTKWHVSQHISVFMPLIPYMYKEKYESGVKEERLLLENPCEFSLSKGNIVIDCPRTIILTSYHETQQITEAHFRVAFDSNELIERWELSALRHSELFPLHAAGRTSQPIPQPETNALGIPPSMLRYLHVVDTVSGMRSIMQRSFSQAAQPHPPS